METLSDTQRVFLARLAGDNFVEDIEKETADRQAELVGAGVDSKSADAESAKETPVAVVNIATTAETELKPEAELEAENVVEAVAEPKPVSESDSESESELEEDSVDALRGETEVAIKFLGDRMKLQGDTLQKIAGVLLESEKTDEQKIAETIEMTPRASLLSIAESAVNADETKVDGRSKLVKGGPEEAEAPSPGGGYGVPLLDNIKKANKAHANRGQLRPSAFGR